MTNPQSFQSDLDNIISNTTIKRACCVQKTDKNNPDMYKINVKLPIPDGYIFDGDPVTSALQQKLGYINKEVKIPKSLCDSSYNGPSDNCDNFMYLYCNNAKSIYKNDVTLVGSVYSDDEFVTYAPECACYGNPPDFMKNRNMSGLPKTCYLNGCDPNNTGVYLDKTSREKPCNSTICSTIFNVDNIKAGGSANLNSAVTQNCGDQIADAKNQATADNIKDSLTKKLNDNNSPISSSNPPTSSNLPTSSNPPTSSNLPTSSNPPSDSSNPANSQQSSNSPASSNSPSDSSNPINSQQSSNSQTSSSDIPTTSPPTSSSSGINKYFTSEGNYIGFIIIALIILLICLCCSSFVYISKSRK
jgi:hypothetical protein